MNALTDPSVFTEAKTSAKSNLFEQARLAAAGVEIGEKRSASEIEQKLTYAMSLLYEFGENLLGSDDNFQEAAFLDFCSQHGVKINVRKRQKPYIALVEAAFQNSSASSRSQRATVLMYARHEGTAPDALKGWLTAKDAGGIKGRLKEAVAHFGSTAAENNQAEREARQDRAREHLRQLPGIGSLHLEGVKEGFAVLIAHVDAEGQATVVKTLYHTDSNPAKLDAILIECDPKGPARHQLLASKPLGRLWRAVDLVTGLTLQKWEGKPRYVSIRNLTIDKKPVCEVMALTSSRNEATARVVLAGHLEGIPADDWVTLDSEGAALFLSAFAEHENWRIEGAAIIADGLTGGIPYGPLPDGRTFRVPRDEPATSKTLAITHHGMRDALDFIADQENGHKPSASNTKQYLPMPPLMAVQLDEGQLRLSVLNAPRYAIKHAPFAVVGTSNHEPEPMDRELAVADVRRLATALTNYEADATGCFVDTEVEDACLRMEADLNGDVLHVNIPMRDGESSNDFCCDLVI